MAAPKISVVMPCYNYGNYIPETIDSALSQTFTNFELIIVDDCSNDGTTPAVVAEQAEKDPRIKAIFSPQNNGASASYNIAVKAAQGTYIFPLDADDKIAPTFLEKAIAKMEQENADVVYCHYQLFGTENKTAYYPPSLKEIKKKMLFHNRVPGCCLYKKADWERVGGYDETMSGYEDWNFWLHFVEANKKFALVDEVLYYQRMHGESVNDRALEIHNNLYKRIKKNHPNLYKWHRYYFSFGYFRFVVRPWLFQLRTKRGRRIFRLLGITFYKD